MKRGFAAALIAVLLAGCATSGHKFDASAITSFQPGVTTMTQAEAALGQPFQSTKMPDGTQQLQYVSKVQSVEDNMPTTGFGDSQAQHDHGLHHAEFRSVGSLRTFLVKLDRSRQQMAERSGAYEPGRCSYAVSRTVRNEWRGSSCAAHSS